MVRLNCKLRGTTLIETLVAMTLLVIVFSWTFLSVISIHKSFNNDLRTYAYLNANKYIEESDSMMMGSQVIYFPSFSLKISKEQYQDNPNLYILTVSAMTKDSITLYELKGIHKAN